MEQRRVPPWLSVPGAVLVGVLTAIQARMNGSLSASIDDGFVAGFISFGSGFVIVALISLLLPAGRAGAARLVRALAARDIPVWMLLGGLAGAFSVATQGLTVPTIGVAMFTVGVVAGQTVNGLVLDRLGYGPAGVVAVTMGRVGGGALAVAAVVICLAGDGVLGVPGWMLVLPFFAGAAIAWQQAANGRLRTRIGSPLTATLVNFAGGASALGIAALVHIGFVGAPATYPTDPWLYFGGALGVVYIVLSAALVRHTGVLLLGLGSVIGLLATSIVLDALMPPVSGPSLPRAITAVAVALAGVVIAVVPWRRRRGRR